MNSRDNYTLEDWAKLIEEKAVGYGLDFYPQEFEIVDADSMIAQETYNGIPSYYPHWSFGKGYDRTETLYRYRLTGLAYELVINSNPCTAYLMANNPTAIQILVMAHVYGHNSFFKNNFYFRTATRAESAMEFFRTSSQRIRAYIADPAIGPAPVEKFLNAGHALMHHGHRIVGRQYISQAEQRRKMMGELRRPKQYEPWAHLKQKKEETQFDLKRFPLEPEENLLLFLRDYSPRQMEDWQKDILTILSDIAEYFLPQGLTKIMNEGWATYWHNRLTRELGLSDGMRLAIADANSSVIAKPRVDPGKFRINPYLIGLRIWEDIYHRYETPNEKDRKYLIGSGSRGLAQIKHVMRTSDDESFLRAYLTPELMCKLELFHFAYVGRNKNDAVKIDDEITEDNWRNIRDILIKNIGVNASPIIKIKDADYTGTRCLYLVHDFDGRFLEKEYARKTLEYIYELWGRTVYLETMSYDEKKKYFYRFDGQTHTLGKEK